MVVPAIKAACDATVVLLLLLLLLLASSFDDEPSSVMEDKRCDDNDVQRVGVLMR